LRNQAGIDERPDEQDEAGRVAARVRDPLGRAQPGPLVGGELGQPIDPVAGGAVRGARVDQAGLRVRDQRRRLARRRVGQAEEGDVGGVEQP
jgi:hypothetical protein